jgi:hypothetical protein
LQCFDGYVAVWRAAGFLLTWRDPRTVVITRGGLDAGPHRPEVTATTSIDPTPHKEASQDGQARFTDCQTGLLQGHQRPTSRMARGVQYRQRGCVSFYQTDPVCSALALGKGMNQTPKQAAFAWWASSSIRAQRSIRQTPITGLKRRPFSRGNQANLANPDSALPKAEIFPFTGSNTPYESHE